ncbi:alpha/beta hydrolase family protein [Sarocladium implicatum]|nr:alpha/beta hydrolase family protein [Sarocladium implicatum]
MRDINTTVLEPGVPGSGRELELLVCLPSTQTAPDKPALFFLHGAFCSAWDYHNFLPYFASHGYPAYSLSLRGHGKSWSPASWRLQLLTTMDDHRADIKFALRHISQQSHPDAPLPVLCGHSFGGGYLQYVLSQETKNAAQGSKLASGLVLLGSAPIWGGAKQIMANWEQVETHGKGYAYPWSPRSQLETPTQVREAFFTPETDEEAIEYWLKTCRTEKEGLRTGIAAFWPFGEVADVLTAIQGFGDAQGLRKVHMVGAANDALVTVDIVQENFKKYRVGLESESTVTQTIIPNSGHHLMMDTKWESCAEDILQWLAG